MRRWGIWRLRLPARCGCLVAVCAWLISGREHAFVELKPKMNIITIDNVFECEMKWTKMNKDMRLIMSDSVRATFDSVAALHEQLTRQSVRARCQVRI